MASQNSHKEMDTRDGHLQSPPYKSPPCSPIRTIKEKTTYSPPGTQSSLEDDASLPDPPPLEDHMLSPRTPRRFSNGGRPGQGSVRQTSSLMNPHSASYALTPTIRNTHGTARAARTSSVLPIETAAVVSPDEKWRFCSSDLPREIGFESDADEFIVPRDLSNLIVSGENAFGEECEELNGKTDRFVPFSYRPSLASEVFDYSVESVKNEFRNGINSESTMTSASLLPLCKHAKSLPSGAIEPKTERHFLTRESFMPPCEENVLSDDDDCDDTIEDSDLNYQGDDLECDEEDHIAKIEFPTNEDKNLSFRSLDEGGFRRALQSSSIKNLMARNSAASRVMSNCSPLTVGSLERRPSGRTHYRGSSISRNMPYTLYQPSRDGSLGEFGLREAALNVASIFQDDHSLASTYTGNDINLYRPVPMRRGNSTGSQYSIPSLRMGAPLPSAWDDGSMSTYMGSLADALWHESAGEVGGSFDEADLPSNQGAFFISLPPMRHSKQAAFDWLEEVRKEGDCVVEAASSKFLREQQSSKSAVLTNSARAATPTPPCGKPPLALKRPTNVGGVTRAVSMPLKHH